jgi:putative MATE family efflux protein
MEKNTTKKTRNLTEGSPWRLLFLFALPLMIGNIFQQMYTVVDTAVVGKVLGVDALAALGSIDWMNWMMTSIMQGFAQGFAILMAQKFGAGDHTKLRQVVTHSILLAAALSVGFLIAGQGLAQTVIFNLLKTPEEIRGLSLCYMRVMYGGVPVVMAYNLAAAVLRSLGNSKTPLVAMVIASVTNIVLDLLFVPVFGWGVGGAAIATVLAQICSALYCLYHIRKIEILKLQPDDWRFHLSLAGNLMRVGVPMALQNSIIALGGMIVQSVVNGFGVVFLAGYTATNKLYGILEIAAISYGYAMTTYAGQNLGAGKLRRISQGIRAGIWIAVLTSLVIMAFMIVFGKSILGLFISADPVMEQQVLQIAYRYLVIMSVCLPILYILHVVRSYVQGLGNTVLPMISGIAEFVVRTGGAFLLPLLLGENGILLVEIFAWIGADLILIPSYLVTIRGIRQKSGI